MSLTRARKISVKTRIAILLGSTFSKCVAIMFCFGLVLSIHTIQHTDFSHEWQNSQVVVGTINKIETTGFGQYSHEIYKYTFTYLVDGYGLENYSFGPLTFRVGDNIDVEYLTEQPSKSRMVGLREKELSPSIGIVFAGLTPIPFLIICGKYFKTARILKYGVKVKGKLIKREETPFANRGPGGTYYYRKYHFRYKDQNGKEHTVIEWATAPNVFETTKDRTVMFDPFRPESARVLSLTNGAPLIVSDEEVKTESGFISIICTLIIMAVIMLEFINSIASIWW